MTKLKHHATCALLVHLAHESQQQLATRNSQRELEVTVEEAHTQELEF